MLEPTDDAAPADEAAAAQTTATAAKKAAKKPAKKAAKKAAKKTATKTAAATAAPQSPDQSTDLAGQQTAGGAADAPAERGTGKGAAKAPRKRAAKAAPAPSESAAAGQRDAAGDGRTDGAGGTARTGDTAADGSRSAAMAAPGVLFQPPAVPDPESRPAKKAAATKTAKKQAAKKPATKQPAAKAAAKSAGPGTSDEAPATDLAAVTDPGDGVAEPDDVREAAIEEATGARRRRRRGRRGRGGGGGQQGDAGATDAETDDGDDDAADGTDADAADDPGADAAEGTDGTGPGTHRRRRRRRSGGSGGAGGADGNDDDPPNTVTHVREARGADDGVRGVKGSTRLEAKRQRRRDGRETNRRRPPILTEAEFLARREAVDRVMAVRQTGDRTQIAVLEDDILVEHYVTRASATSYVGNVYLGRVQNVLPSMEAAFIDIGKGRNGVLYAGEVNWDAAGLEGKSRAIEQALKSGDTVLVQVTKDPIGHKGARLTSQISLPGRFLVYVPGGGMTGISRKLPDTERHRLKAILKKIVPEDAGVIIRTAAEGASEEDLTRDVERLKAQWETISKKAEKTSSAPTLVHGEPDLAIRVVRDVFNEDFNRLVVQGDAAWTTVSEYVGGVAPDLAERVSRHTSDKDLFSELRVDEQLAKALDRKVWLPSGGSLVIDRTEAMTVVDVNTGKFVGSGGNLEQTVTRNNLEAAEEIVRQLRLRDVGGIVVIDFIDMVLESNRELVLRRLTECLGRDRTKHQVAEVTSLGLVQMTRKRVGEGLLEAFSEPCEVCRGRGVIIHSEPVDRQPSSSGDDEGGGGSPRGRRKRGGAAAAAPAKRAEPELTAEELALEEERRAAARAAMSAIHRAAHPDDDHDDHVHDLDEGADDLMDDLNDLNDLEALDGISPDLLAEAIDAALDAEQADHAQDDLEPLESGEPGGDAAPTSDPTPAAAVAGPAKPRRRRAASRPAGPPVGAETS